MSAGFDITLNGVNYRLLRGEEGPAYRKGARRYTKQSFDIPTGSRIDQAVFWQSDWSGGATWWKPLVIPGQSTYFTLRGFNTFDKPGFAVPIGAVTEDTESSLLDRGPLVRFEDDIYAVGNTQNEDATNYDVYKLASGSSDNFAQETGYTSGNVSARIFGLYFDDTDNYVYCLGLNHLSRFNIGTSATDASWIANTQRQGANVVGYNGKILVYDGTNVQEVDKSGASLSTFKDDLLGKDFLSRQVYPGNTVIMKTEMQLCISTGEGLFYVKNVLQGGLPRALVYRVYTDTAGNDILKPVGSLPPGNVALSINEHMGSILVMASPDVQKVLLNDQANYPRVVLYHITDGQLGVVGWPLGEQPDETPFKLIGAYGQYMFIGGAKRVWVYDSVRGGIHPILEGDNKLGDGVYHSMAQIENAAGDSVFIFYGDQKLLRVATDDLIGPAPKTVTNFGDDLTTYVIESNYFDFGTPHENKTIVACEVASDTLDASQQYTIQLAVDDGAFATVASHTNATYSSTAITKTGKRFRYKVIYETKDSNRHALRNLQFVAEHGKMVPTWQFRIDLRDSANVENSPQDLATLRDAINTLQGIEAPVTLVDFYQSENVADSSTHTVTVDSAVITKSTRNEAIAEVQVTETTP